MAANRDDTEAIAPRKRLDPFDPDRGDASGEELLRTLGWVIRTACLVVAFMLFGLGVYYAIQVFQQLRVLIAEPQGAEGAVASIAQLIDADHLVIQQAQGEPVKLGRIAAYVILLATYVVWMWVPLGIMSVTGRLLLAALQRQTEKQR